MKKTFYPQPGPLRALADAGSAAAPCVPGSGGSGAPGGAAAWPPACVPGPTGTRPASCCDMLPSKRTVKKALNAEKGAFCMSRKNKISSKLKKKVVRMCKSGQVSQAEAARRCGVSESTIKRWLSRERSEGCAGLESEATNRVYPSELKLQAVTAYLTGKYSQQEICEKFKIKSTRQLTLG